jgi:addiction module toxin, relE/stbE family
LIGTTEPRRHGKGLTSNRSGQWRYRVGDYRIIADIEDEKLIILVVEVEHRSRVYK